MVGATRLDDLIGSMSPTLHPEVFVYASLPPGEQIPSAVEPLLAFREAEGLTVILKEEEATAAGIASTFCCRMITLSIHSSLEAVGFLAAVAACLANAGIAVNPVSGYFHDHLFVPQERANDALDVLKAMSAKARNPLKIYPET